MRNRRYGLGMLGVLAVVGLGVTAFAASAQALTSEFLIAKKLPAAELNATLSGKQEGVSSFLISALNVEINCTGFTVVEGITNSNIDGKAKVLHEGCTVLTISPLEEATGCEIVTADTGSVQKHITSTALILPAELKDGSPALLAEKIEAKVLTATEKGCVLPTTTVIKGEICFKIDNNDTVELKLLSNKTIQGECLERTALEGTTIGKGFTDKLLFGTQEAFVDETSTLFLTGEKHKGLTLGVSLQ